jgi:excisionase family DNA binding protein
MNCLTFSVNEAADILGVSRGLLYSQIRSGELKAIKFGRKVVITRATVEELLGHPIEVVAK